MSQLLWKQDDWLIILLFWGLSFEVGWQIPVLGLVAAGFCGLICLVEWAQKSWWWLVSEEDVAFRAATSIITALLFFIWLAPGLTVGYWLPWIGHLFQHINLC